MVRNGVHTLGGSYSCISLIQFNNNFSPLVGSAIIFNQCHSFAVSAAFTTAAVAAIAAAAAPTVTAYTAATIPTLHKGIICTTNAYVYMDFMQLAGNCRFLDKGLESITSTVFSFT